MPPLFSDIFLGLYYPPASLSTKKFTAILSIVKFGDILQGMSFGKFESARTIVIIQREIS
jgi:hypothetical protein